jgi:hypothetical protein
MSLLENRKVNSPIVAIPAGLYFALFSEWTAATLGHVFFSFEMFKRERGSALALLPDCWLFTSAVGDLCRGHFHLVCSQSFCSKRANFLSSRSVQLKENVIRPGGGRVQVEEFSESCIVDWSQWLVCRSWRWEAECARTPYYTPRCKGEKKHAASCRPQQLPLCSFDIRDIEW